MRKIDAELAIVDMGNSKLAMVVPDADAMTRAGELAAQAICKATVEERVVLHKEVAGQEGREDEVVEDQRAQALLKVRERAEKKSQQRVRKVLLLAAEPELQAVSPQVASPQATRREQELQMGLQQAVSQKKWKKLNPIALDRNKRPLALYAMPNERWKAYERIAYCAGVKIVGFIFPAIAVGNALITQNYKHPTRQERLKQFPESFIVLDLGARYISIAMFNDGLPCAIATIEFGSQKFNEALINAFQLSSKRAEQLKYSLCFSESLLDAYSDAITKQKNKGVDEISSGLTEKHYEEAVEVQRIFPRNIKVARNPLAQRKDAQGAERILAPIYEKAMQKVVRTIEYLAPRFSKNAPVYMCGGGAAIAGIQTLTAHLLKRCVFPALLPRVTGSAIRAPIHSISALAALFAIGGGHSENKVRKNPNPVQAQQFNFSQHSSSNENLEKTKITDDVENKLMVNARGNEVKTHA